MKNKKLITLVSTGVLAIGIVGGGVYIAQAHNLEKTEKRAEDTKNKEMNNKKIDTLLKAIYTDSTYTDVHTNVSAATVKSATLVSTNTADKSNEKVKELAIGLKLVNLKKAIANLFENEGVAKDTLDEKQFDTIQKNIVSIADKKEKFANEASSQLQQAKNSYTQAKNTKESVANLFDKDNVKDSVTRDEYQTALDQVTVLKQVTLKDELVSKLALVDAKLAEKEQAVLAEEQAVQVQKEAEEQAIAQSNATAQGNGEGSSNAGYTDNSSSTSAPQGGGSQQGNNSNASSPTPQPPTNPPVSGGMNPGDKWTTGGATGGGDFTNEVDHNNGTGGNNSSQHGDWDYN